MSSNHFFVLYYLTVLVYSTKTTIHLTYSNAHYFFVRPVSKLQPIIYDKTFLHVQNVMSGVFVHSLYIYIYKNVVFPAQAEYFYFSADFRMKIFLYYS